MSLIRKLAIHVWDSRTLVETELVSASSGDLPAVRGNGHTTGFVVQRGEAVPAGCRAIPDNKASIEAGRPAGCVCSKCRFRLCGEMRPYQSAEVESKRFSEELGHTRNCHHHVDRDSRTAKFGAEGARSGVGGEV